MSLPRSGVVGAHSRFGRGAGARSRLFRYGLVGVNIVIIAGLVAFVLYTSKSSNAASVPARTERSGYVTNPIDQISSTDIAANLARVANLPEATAVKNQAESANAQLAISQVSDSLVAKPQIVATDFLSNKDIKIYVVKKGDTMDKLTNRFNVSSSSIRASNALASNSLTPGMKLYIPPVDGVIYTIKSGDTAASLASKYSANKATIIAFNDAEIKGFTKGERIVIPGGENPTPTSSTGFYAGSGYGLAAWGYGPIYGSNGYDYGECTWYVANNISVPSNWGNANTWAYYAQAEGWNVTSVPSVGAIAQTPFTAGGFGHVAIVTAVSGNKIQIKEMNHLGWDVVDTRWTDVSQFPHYITH